MCTIYIAKFLVRLSAGVAEHMRQCGDGALEIVPRGTRVVRHTGGWNETVPCVQK